MRRHLRRLTRPTAVAVALVLVAAGCAGKPAGPAPVAPTHAHWSYEGESGPDRWGDLDPAYALAKTGTAQSPIDLRALDATPASSPPPAFSYRAAPLTVENNGHTIQVTCAPGGTLTVGDAPFELKQFHFHAPSEHTVSGGHAPLEVHFVHADAGGRLAVVALLVHPGDANGALGEVLAHAPRERGEKVTVADLRFDPTSLLPASHATWRYDGSLTTPPCTEGVHWLVLQAPGHAADAQLREFHAIFGGNNRPTQPLHGRKVESVR